ncbi:HalOD1 output domain-containing protein [Halopiger thermotolerans]
MPSTDTSDDTQRYVATFDPDGERASEAVVTAVADLIDADPTSISPLYDAVDPDALDSLVAHARRADDAGTHELRFAYEGFDVGVRTDGRIQIEAANAPANSSA